MLDSEAADIADALSRVCVFRTEDYQLLHQIHTSVQSTSHEADSQQRKYLSLLVGELQRRENWRQQRERELLSRLSTWQKDSFDQLTRVRECAELSALQDVYAACIRHTYNFQLADLEQNPFARLPSSGVLFAVSATTTTTTTGSAISAEMRTIHSRLIHTTAAPSTVTKDSPHAHHGTADDLVDELFPLPKTPVSEKTSENEGQLSKEDGGEAVAAAASFRLKAETRQGLRASRRAWQMLLLFWVHLLRQTSLKAVREEVRELPATAASELLSSQRDALEKLLRRTCALVD